MRKVRTSARASSSAAAIATPSRQAWPKRKPLAASLNGEDVNRLVEPAEPMGACRFEAVRRPFAGGGSRDRRRTKDLSRFGHTRQPGDEVDDGPVVVTALRDRVAEADGAACFVEERMTGDDLGESEPDGAAGLRVGADEHRLVTDELHDSAVVGQGKFVCSRLELAPRASQLRPGQLLDETGRADEVDEADDDVGPRGQ